MKNSLRSKKCSAVFDQYEKLFAKQKMMRRSDQYKSSSASFAQQKMQHRFDQYEKLFSVVCTVNNAASF